MKKVLLMVSLLGGLTTYAQNGEVTLKSTMKQMAGVLKTITTQATDGSKNSQSAALALQFVQTAQTAKTIYPSSANDDVSKAKYNQMMDSIIADGTELQAAFASNDNAKASVILNRLVQQKKDGHDQFRQ